MKIHLVRTKEYQVKEITKVYNLLFPIPGFMRFVLTDKALLFETNNFEWDELFDAAATFRAEKQIPEEDIIVVITTLKNKYNWFSAPNIGGHRDIFIDASDWENYIYAEPAYPIAFEVIINVIQLFMLKSYDSPIIHQESIGCINDFCGWKPDITFKLRTADICGDCLSAMEETLPDKSMISQSLEIMEVLRQGMLYSKLWRKNPEFETHLPFPVELFTVPVLSEPREYEAAEYWRYELWAELD